MNVSCGSRRRPWRRRDWHYSMRMYVNTLKSIHTCDLLGVNYWVNFLVEGIVKIDG